MRFRPLPCLTVLSCVAAACADGTPVGTNQAPTVTIDAPSAGSLFAGGDEIAVAVSATDPEDGRVGAGGLTWWVVLHHDTHTHPYVPPTGGAGGTVDVARAGHLETDIWLRVYGLAVDSDGAVDTAFVDIDPRLVTITLETVPPGLQVTVEGLPSTAPTTVESVVGMERTLGAPSPQNLGGSSYALDAWAHGPTAEHTYVAPASDVTLTATFIETGVANDPPTVTLTSPADGAVVTQGVATTLTADAADADGSVSFVQFLIDGALLATDSDAPYQVAWTPSALGARTITARATDDGSATTTSDAVTVTVQSSGSGDVTAPVATLTSPSQGATGLGGSVDVTADATDNVGVTEVEFQLDGATLSTDTEAPWTATLPSTSEYASGAHTFRARARDAAGNWSPWSAASVTFGGGVSLPAGFTRTTIASGFDSFLTGAAFAPDGRLFVLEQSGDVRVIKDGALLATPFASPPVQYFGEGGLLGIAFDPDYETNGYVYLNYTYAGGSSVRNRISRFTGSGDVAEAGSEVVLAELDDVSTSSIHYGGALAFGPDGMLYVAVGDNGRSTVAQGLDTRLGKMLRYAPDGSIPTDNPYYGTATGPNRAIWAIGLRNPYTFAFHPVTGRMHINDVGLADWEEINLGTAGANYGWPATEGPTTDPAFTGPIYAYGHFGGSTLITGVAIVGGSFYVPSTNLFGETYENDYFFADYATGGVYRLESDGWDTAYAFATVDTDITNLIVGDDGALYLLIGTRVDRVTR